MPHLERIDKAAFYPPHAHDSITIPTTTTDRNQERGTNIQEFIFLYVCSSKKKRKATSLQVFRYMNVVNLFLRELPHYETIRLRISAHLLVVFFCSFHVLCLIERLF